ncbi:MAG: hypothetical protein M3R36_17950 [Bacteroidota bacterium]|nr:hypothetical protein [Bacteroidota bacterium]
MKQSSSSPKSKESNYKKYFEELRKENFDESFPSTESWLRSIDTNLINSKNEKSERKFTIMKIKNYFTANKFKLAYTFLILAFFVAACNYPVTQQESAGDVMKWSVSKNDTEALNKIENLDWIRNGEVNINEENINGQDVINYSFIIPKEKHASVSDYEKQLEAIGVNDINLIPLNETVKRPVYSALLNDLFKIDINASNMSDAELEREITTQLKNAGLEVAQIDFKNDSEGRRVLKIVIPDGQLKADGGFDMTIKDGNNITKMKEVRKTGEGDHERFKGKTDEEIRKMIREDLQVPDLKDDQIEIIRKDGNVMVKVKRSEVKGNKKLEIEDEIK